MSILSGSVTFSRFAAGRDARAPSDARRWLAKGLARGAFAPIDLATTEDGRAAGFVELEDRDATGFAVGSVVHGEYALFAYRIDAIRVPAAAVKAELARWAATFEAEHARPPRRSERARARDGLRHALRQRTPPSTRVLDVALHLASREVQVWGASRKAIDEVVAALEGAFELKLEPRSPAGIAARAGIAGAALGPTEALVGTALAPEEADRGEA